MERGGEKNAAQDVLHLGDKSMKLAYKILEYEPYASASSHASTYTTARTSVRGIAREWTWEQLLYRKKPCVGTKYRTDSRPKWVFFFFFFELTFIVLSVSYQTYTERKGYKHGKVLIDDFE